MKMGIKQTLERIALPIALGFGLPIASVATGIGMYAGVNFYQHQNVNYEIVMEGKKVFQKVDGIFGYTELEINKDGSVIISKYSFENGISYTDEDGDGNVDRIIQLSNLFVRGSYSNIFSRDKNLKQYPNVFQDADRDFRQQMQRFKPYMNR